MREGFLSEYFEGVGVKTLSSVDAEPGTSNQHEIGTINGMRTFLGEDKRRFDVSYVWLNDEQESIEAYGTATHYNTREGKPRSAEFRLYYTTNDVTKMMAAGDTLFIALRPDQTMLFIVVPEDSAILQNILWLFGLDRQPQMRFFARQYNEGEGVVVDFLSRYLLDLIGIEFEDPNANTIDTIIEPFGMKFPDTATFSNLARLTLPDIDAQDDPDRALLAWLDHEEAMFRRLENRIVSERLGDGFVNDAGSVDVEDFIHYSLRVQNRRKSRMGHSFEHQLKAVFDSVGLRYDSQVITEKGKKPDFIFPGKNEYEDEEFSSDLLTMLAAKSSCKDRWAQILPEAEKIKTKHLVTLEPGISVAQTTTMEQSSVQLIVPSKIQSSYTEEQKRLIMSVNDFIQMVSKRQSQC